MKKRFFITLLLLSSTNFLFAQPRLGERVKERTKNQTENRVENKSEQTVDKAMNKVEDGINNLFKKKEKKPKKGKSSNSSGQASSQSMPGYDPPVTQTDNEGNTNYNAYKNFDFVPGENILFFEDFADGSLQRWGAYDKTSDLAIVNKDGINWLEVKNANFFPMNLKALPKSFTLEFDVLSEPNSAGGTLSISMFDESQANRLGDPWFDNYSYFTLSPISQMPKTGLGQYGKKINNSYTSPQNEYAFYSWQPDLGNYYAKISLSVDNGRASLWVNKEKVADNVDLLALNRNYYLCFGLANYFISETRMYFTNFRLATGGANPKTELNTKKNFVTANIHFDVNSDVIRPNSYQILKQIAESIQQTNGNIMIVGHTDSDGNAQNNMVLSQKRAASVKRALVNEFGVEASRLTTDGKGQTQPLNKNSNASEKAMNRRVEFQLQ